MDLHKKTLIGTLASFTLLSIISAIIIFLQVGHSYVDLKISYVFVLIFSLCSMVCTGATAFFSHRDGIIETKEIVIFSALFIISLFSMISASIFIDAINNPMSATISGGKAVAILPAIGAIITIPAIAGAGYLLAL